MVAPRSIYAQVGLVGQFLRYRVLAEITRDEIAAMGARARADSSNATANRYLALIRAILRKASPGRGAAEEVRVRERPGLAV